MLEKTIEKQVVEWCKANNILHQKLLGRKGMPDRVFYLSNGRAVFVEFKRPKKKPRPLQEYYIEKLCKMGFCAIVSSEAQDVIDYLNYFLKR